jgi:DNA-binding protein YbaB
MEKIHKQMQKNLMNMEKEKQKLEAELTSGPKINFQSQGKIIAITYQL